MPKIRQQMGMMGMMPGMMPGDSSEAAKKEKMFLPRFRMHEVTVAQTNDCVPW